MTTMLIGVLIVLDILLVAFIFFSNQRKNFNVETLGNLAEERRMLTEFQEAVREELKQAQYQAQQTLEKAAQLAAEAEQEVKAGGSTIASEIEKVASEMGKVFDSPIKEMGKKQAYLESLLRRVDEEKSVLQKMLARGEKICKFFDERIPYEEVLAEIEDKKYADARALLAKGKSPSSIARDLGLSETEVRLVAGFSQR